MILILHSGRQDDAAAAGGLIRAVTFGALEVGEREREAVASAAAANVCVRIPLHTRPHAATYVSACC